MIRIVALIALIVLQAVGGASFAAEPLGRLFFTPTQRDQLDTARNQKSRATLSSQEEAAPLPETVTYSGIVRRNDGKSTVWLNNRAINDRQPVDGVPAVGRVRPDGRIILDTQQPGQNIELKVGQSVEIISGTIEEPYARRATATSPGPKTKPVSGQAAETASPARSKRGDERDIDAGPAVGAPSSSAGPAGGASKGN